ncbi:helix-turn-helix domain-containing protein [Scytonema sp. NUACC26]|uniref:helix-turn-helix domain-containing protein n=1 Tax=Scytonema sp. NUACC26 TaxID=3140176 RepID=UPI0034DC2B7A
MNNNPYIGSSFDDFLKEEGLLEEINLIAVKRVIAWQIEQAMEQKNLTKTEMAAQMQTSKSSLDRLLDPEDVSVTLETIERAARAVGKRVHFELVDAE